MKFFATIAVATAAACCSFSRAAAINPDAADAQIQVNANGGGGVVFNTDDYQARIGEYFYPGHAVYVAPFQLPALPAGQGFTDVSLRFQLFDKLGAAADIDLYGLGVRDSSTVLASDDYVGTADTANTLIQQSFINGSSPLRTDGNTGPFVTTSAAGSTSLADYLNLAYAGGANAGKYVFLRLNPQANPNGNNFYSVLTQNAGGGNEKPLLTYTPAPVPEPAALAALGLCGVLGLRRQRSK